VKTGCGKEGLDAISGRLWMLFTSSVEAMIKLQGYEFNPQLIRPSSHLKMWRNPL
jgi:hypothetical protein